MIAIDGLTTVSSGLGQYLKGLLSESKGDAGQSSWSQQTEEDRGAETARKQKKWFSLSKNTNTVWQRLGHKIAHA